MLRLSAQNNDQLRHAVTQLAPEPIEPVPAWLTEMEADWLLDEPELPELDCPVDDSWAASTTSILPPNWKELFLTWDLFLTKVAVSHEQVWAAARLFYWTSGMVLRDEPAVASAFEVWATSWACPRAGKPVVVELSRTQTHPAGGGLPGVPGPPGVVNVKLQLDGYP